MSPSSRGGEPLDRWHQDVAVKTLGEQFTDSAGSRARQRVPRERPASREGFSTGAVGLDMKGTLLEGAGGGGGALARPSRRSSPASSRSCSSR
jgi:hypothetical protein